MCAGVVCGCGGLGQPLSYGLNSGTDCATCLAAGVGCVAYYANLWPLISPLARVAKESATRV